MRTLATSLVVAALLCAGATNAQSKADKRPATRAAADTPEHFVPQEGVSLNGTSCKSPMVDERDGTILKLAASAGGEGDYLVPEGKYGVMKGEYLRLDCSTGEVIGIVRKKQRK